MALKFASCIKFSPDNPIEKPFLLYSNGRKISLPTCCSTSLVARNYFPSAFDACIVVYGSAENLCQTFCGLKLWILEKLNLEKPNCKHRFEKKSKRHAIQERDDSSNHLETSLSSEGKVFGNVSATSSLSDPSEETKALISQLDETSVPSHPLDVFEENRASVDLSSFTIFNSQCDGVPALCIAVIGATGELARKKIFPALFALYYSGFLPENVGIFGYSRNNLTDEDLRSIIASNLTCRVDHQQNCGDKMDAFLSRTYFINGGNNNRVGMARLNVRMEQIEGKCEANRIFYLSVPHEALLDVASSLADHAQTQGGWNRIIIEKPFGFDALSSYQLTQSLLSKFDEKQIYRIDHLLGKNLIENLTVLRFSNLVFEPLWSRAYIRNVQVILSEDRGLDTRGRYFDEYGIIRDIVHSHLLQTIALFAMAPPISLDDEDVRNEKVKVLRSICKLELGDVVLGQCKASSTDKVDVYMNTLTPTFFAAALYIDNARWDGVPFLIKTGIGLIKHRMEIRIQFHQVPGNLYRECIGQNIDLATNELILRDVPDEAILVKMNNKVPGLGLQLDASELNLLYKDKYNVEVPEAYEHLLLDVIDGDNHLFMRSDELAAAWNILTPVLCAINENKIAPELYEVGGRGPVGAYYLGAKHGVRWADD